MQKSKSYHEAAIVYNEKLAEFAEALSKELDHAVIRQWCASVSKQHKFHANRHKNALRRLKSGKARKQTQEVEENFDIPEVHDAEPTLEDAQKAFAEQFEEREVSRDAGSGQFVSHEYADEHPGTTVTETVEVTKKVAHTHSHQLPCGPGCPAYNEEGE